MFASIVTSVRALRVLSPFGPGAADFICNNEGNASCSLGVYHNTLFPMSIVSFIVVFVCTWWVVLFTVLPWGIQLDESGPEVSGPGAPVKPNLKKEILDHDGIAAVISSRS